MNSRQDTRYGYAYMVVKERGSWAAKEAAVGDPSVVVLARENSWEGAMETAGRARRKRRQSAIIGFRAS